jgi:soluble lytic murein transglycosylase
METAATYYKRAAAADVKTNESGLAAMRLGGIEFVNGRFQEAERIFQQYRKTHPNGAYIDQATYWAARSAQERGNTALANDLMTALRNKSTVSYYGMLARTEADAAAVTQGVPAGPVTDSTIALAVHKNLDRWLLLREIGWNDAAALELTRVKQHFANNTAAQYQLAESLNGLGAPHLGIAMGRDLLSANAQWNTRLFKIMYPLPYMDAIVLESRANRLDPYFVAALIRQESRFNANARSGAGAIGLMQVMPATGRALQRSAGVGPVTPETLTDPVTNIKLGTRFLADVMNTYNGNPDLALIAYNAGPSRASRWRSFPEFRRDHLFVERIPFDETRDYVKVVKLNAAIYRALYPVPQTSD